MRPQQQWQRAAWRRAMAAVVALLAGLVLIAVFDGTVRVIGVVLVGVAVTALVALAFYEVGLSEDRDRSGQPR